MTQPAKRNATYDDLIGVPEHLTAEIVFGDLYLHRHSASAAVARCALSGELGGPFQIGVGGPGGFAFMSGSELHLGPHVVVPDVAGWRRERMPHMPAKAYIEVAPDWICEITSPSTESVDRGPKRRIYATYGVGYMWLLNPVSKYLEVHALLGKDWVHVETFQDGEEVKAPPFDAVPFQMADLWPLPPAPETPA